MVNYNNYYQFWLERLSYDAIQNGKNKFTKEEIQWALSKPITNTLVIMI